jgi:glycosyltransferase involved in cell wall biosynthesis
VRPAAIPPDGSLAQRIKSNYTSAKKVYFVSNQNQKIVEKQLAVSLSNAEVVSNPFPTIKTEVIKYPSTEETFSLAFVASLSSNHKGHDLLFEVLSQEKWRDRNMIVNLYGKGPHEEYIRNLKQYYNISKVNIIGFLSSVEKIWEDNHALILCSRMEGQSLALLEAMSYNRMPIVTNVGDADMLIEDGINGFLAEAPTVKHIGEALERAWAKRDQWEEMGKRAGIKLKQMRPEDPLQSFASKILRDYADK